MCHLKYKELEIARGNSFLPVILGIKKKKIINLENIHPFSVSSVATSLFETFFSSVTKFLDKLKKKET